MDFITHLLTMNNGHDAVVVFVDRMTKMIKVEPTTTTASAPDIAQIFFKTIFRNYGLPQVMISDRDPKFMSHFWQTLFKTLGAQQALSTTYHLQTDGQTKYINYILKQMLRDYISYK